ALVIFPKSARLLRVRTRRGRFSQVAQVVSRAVFPAADPRTQAALQPWMAAAARHLSECAGLLARVPQPDCCVPGGGVRGRMDLWRAVGARGIRAPALHRSAVHDGRPDDLRDADRAAAGATSYRLLVSDAVGGYVRG